MIAEQNKLSAKAGNALDSTPNLASKLQALYGTDGTNKASGKLGGLADLLGVDSETLNSELQGPNSTNVRQLLQQAAILKSMQSSSESSGNLFDTTA
jgi:hypothetical protein